MDQVKVSVIITTYGGDWKLIRALDSVLSQTYDSFEVIIVDDNAPSSVERKKTESYLEAYKNNKRVRYIRHQRNMNGAFARNTGLSEAIGEYVAFLDDDDYYLSNRLKASVNFLDNNPSIDGLCMSVIKIKSGAITEIHTLRDDTCLTVRDLILNQNIIGTGSNIFVRRSALDDINGFDMDFERFQDVEFMLRLCREHCVMMKSEPLIVKDIAGYRSPNYLRVKKAEELFYKKFEEDIQQLSEDERNLFFNDRYTYLFSLAVMGKSTKNLKNASEDLKNVRPLTKKEWISVTVFPMLIPLIQFRLRLAQRDGIIVKVYRRIKNKTSDYKITVEFLDYNLLTKEYYYKFKR